MYLISVLSGIAMVHLRNPMALRFEHRIVGAAQTSKIVVANNQGNKVQAALLDASGNLLQSAVPKTVMGLSVVMPYPWVAFQGWVGGIVSVRWNGSSRFNTVHSAIYYVLTLLLQLAGFSLAAGAGVNVGLSMFKPAEYYTGTKWLGLFPKEAVIDAFRIYALVIPLFIVGSLWEFLSTWNV